MSQHQDSAKIIVQKISTKGYVQKYSRLRCLLRVKGLVIGFYLGWSGHTLLITKHTIKVGSKSWLLTCSGIITLSLPSYNGSALKRELNVCNSYLSLLYFWLYNIYICKIAHPPNCLASKHKNRCIL